MNQFTTFQQFTVREEALELADLLEANNIPYKLETGGEEFNPAFVFNGECRILVHPEDVDKVTALFTSNIDADYYLYGFTNNELLDVIAKRDEWSHLDFILAQQLLKERGVELGEEHIHRVEEERIADLSRPDNVHAGWIIAGYVFALAGGFFGILLGGSILLGKKLLPNGEKVYNYSDSDRSHARRILMIGSITLTAGLMLKVWDKIVALNG